MKRFGCVCVLLVGVVGCGQSGDGEVEGLEGFVCGTDGRTYTVEQAAEGDHEVAYRGRCDDPMGCGPPGECFAGDDCLPHGDVDVCVPVPSGCPCVGVFEPVCGTDFRNYINACEARCVDVEVVFDGMCVPIEPCSDCDECERDYECEPDEICIDWPQQEPAYCVWIGCDNDEQCRPGERCVVDDVCRAPAAVGPCDAAFLGFDVPKLSIALRAGRCEPDVFCTDIGLPVCGVDGVTYGNPCEAERAGVDIAYDGECVAQITCLDRGCPDGSYCGLCWTSYECIPEGAVC